MMGIKEDNCYDEQWVLYVNDESLNSTPEKKNWQFLINICFPPPPPRQKAKLVTFGHIQFLSIVLIRNMWLRTTRKIVPLNSKIGFVAQK